MKTRVIAAVSPGGNMRVIRHTRRTVEFVFLDIGSCPDTEVKDRKVLGQDDWKASWKYFSLE